jgi:outer membrane lipoprotein-sorting protein
VKNIISSKIHFICLLLLLVTAGCLKRTRAIPVDQRLLPAKSAARAELLQGLEEKSKRVQTVKGTITLDLAGGGPKSGVLTEYRQTKAVVAAQRPDHIRIQVQAPIVLTTLATMVSDGIQYKVLIPIKNQFAVGSVNAPLTSDKALNNLRPKIFMDGLFIDVTPYIDKPQFKALFEEAVQGIHSYYVFSFIDVSGREVQLLEKIWVDRTDLQVSRKQVFGPEGKIETDVEYSNYLSDGGIPFPQVIVIHRPSEDYTVKLTFMNRTFNEPIPQEAFNLSRPDGSELVQLTK